MMLMFIIRISGKSLGDHQDDDDGDDRHSADADDRHISLETHYRLSALS